MASWGQRLAQIPHRAHFSGSMNATSSSVIEIASSEQLSMQAPQPMQISLFTL
jgi:hypothetical protein